MWKDDRKRLIIRNIIIAILWLAVAFGLYKLFTEANRRSAAEDASLVGTQTIQRKEQTEAKEQDVSTILQEYDKDMATVQQYLPGVVCWGDNLTTGNTANISYPSVIQDLIDENICNVYDFSLSVSDKQAYGKLDWNSFTVEIPVVNMGGGMEDAPTVLGRAGVIPYVTEKEFTVPADTTAVQIDFKSANGSYVTPLKQGYNGSINPVVIDGIEGTISIDSQSYNTYYSPRYYFQRTTPGEETVIPAGAEIVTDSSDKYNDLIHIVFIGTYGTYYDVAEIVDYAKQLVSRQTQNSDRFIVLGPCVYQGSWEYSTQLDQMDTAMAQEFGSRYISIRRYLCEDGLTAVGGSSNEDADALRGVVPKVFRTAWASVELNGTAYQLIGNLIYDRMDKLGYFDEVKKELYINETLKILAKGN